MVKTGRSLCSFQKPQKHPLEHMAPLQCQARPSVRSASPAVERAVTGVYDDTTVSARLAMPYALTARLTTTLPL